MISIYLNGFLLTFLIETLGRGSLGETLRFLHKYPHRFLCNMFIILATLCLCLFAKKRRYFWQAFISIIWLALGVTNGVIKVYRMTPLTAEDFRLIPDLLLILKNYLTPQAIIGLIVLIAAVIALLIVLYLKLPHKPVKRDPRVIAAIIGVTLLGNLVTNQIVYATDALDDNFKNLADAYDDYGFVYCFLSSMRKGGIGKPDGYSRKAIDKVAASLKVNGDKIVTEPEEDQPDIIMMQLESFFDPYYMKQEYEFSEDPIPFFRSLKEQYPRGFLYVPVVGAGTVNTEFEILTGMSTEFFGAGEYPYNTVLKEKATESIPYILASRGYKSTVLHNNTGTFYNRNGVFSNLGFDCFVPSEYMTDLTYTPTNWARDEIFPELIQKVLEKSEGPDFIYAITVQSHGRYPAEEVLEDPAITVTGPEDESVFPVEYYANQVREVDDMLRELVAYLETRERKTLLVLYGDHLPSLGFDENQFLQPDIYETEYVIWSNYEIDIAHRDLEAQMLSTVVLDAAGIPDGVLPNFHRIFENTDEYTEILNLLEYDMLYGEGYIYQAFSSQLNLQRDKDGYWQAFFPTDLIFGLEPITLDSVTEKDEKWIVTGNNFTESSRIKIDDKIRETGYVDENTLYLDGDIPEKAQTLQVVQCDENLSELGPGTNKLSIGDASQ